MEEDKERITKFSKRKIIVSILLAIILIIIIMWLAIIDNYTIFTSDYDGEYDIQYINATSDGFVITEQMSNYTGDVMTYDEYVYYCEACNLDINYNDENSNYIVYVYDSEYYSQLEIRLGDVSYEDSLLSSYAQLNIWENKSEWSKDGSRQVCFIIIPTTEDIEYVQARPCSKISEILGSLSVEALFVITFSVIFLTICIFFIIGIIKNIANNKKYKKPSKRSYLKLMATFLCLLGLIYIIWLALWWKIY